MVFVDPCSACNFKCTFCPTGDRVLMKEIGRYQGTLSLDQFAVIVANIERFPDPIKVLRLYKDGEPLLNRRLPEMIAMARSSPHIDSIDTTTNGALLTPALSERLVAAGLTRLNISIDGLTDDQYQEFTKTDVTFGDLVENVAYFHRISGDCEVVVKTVSEIIGADHRDRFLGTFEGICDRIFVENTSPCWPDFDVEGRMGIAIKEGLYGNSVREAVSCPYIFYSISVNSDLKVSACFVDWRRDLIVGDLSTDSLADIWSGAKLNTHRKSHLEGRRRKHATCGQCGQLTHCNADNIDSHLELMTERFAATSQFDELDQHIAEEYR